MPTTKSSATKSIRSKVTLFGPCRPSGAPVGTLAITLSNHAHLLQLAWDGPTLLARVPIRGQCYGPTSGEGCGGGDRRAQSRAHSYYWSVLGQESFIRTTRDGWEHGIVLEKGLPVDPTWPIRRPRAVQAPVRPEIAVASEDL